MNPDSLHPQLHSRILLVLSRPTFQFYWNELRLCQLFDLVLFASLRYSSSCWVSLNSRWYTAAEKALSQAIVSKCRVLCSAWCGVQKPNSKDLKLIEPFAVEFDPSCMKLLNSDEDPDLHVNKRPMCWWYSQARETRVTFVREYSYAISSRFLFFFSRLVEYERLWN